MKCKEYASQLIKEGWKIVSREGSKLTLSKNNQQKVIIDLQFDTSVKAAGTGTGWTNSTYIVSSNDAYAEVAILTENVSPFFYAYQFGFAIPADATAITNIEVKIERHASVNSKVFMSWCAIGLYGGTFYTDKSDSTYWTTSDAVQSYSFSPTNWGWAGITVANINNSNFAVKIRGQNIDASTRTAYIDYIEITVTYTPATITLVVAEMLHSQTIDNLVLVQNLTLAIQELLHSQSTDSLVLIENKLLAIQELLHSQNIDNLDIVITGWLLIIQDLLHSQTTDNIVLSQVHNLTVQEILHSQSIEELNLIQAQLLVIQELLHSQTIDSLNLIQQYILTISDILHSQNIDSLSLSQIHNLTIQKLLHSQSIDGLLDLIEKIWAWEKQNNGTDVFTKQADGSQVWTKQGKVTDIWARQSDGVDTFTKQGNSNLPWVRKKPHAYGDPLE